MTRPAILAALLALTACGSADEPEPRVLCVCQKPVPAPVGCTCGAGTTERTK
jgi:hypothetical protein